MERRFSRLPLLWQGVLLGTVIVLATSLFPETGVAPFIYFRF